MVNIAALNKAPAALYNFCPQCYQRVGCVLVLVQEVPEDGVEGGPGGGPWVLQPSFSVHATQKHQHRNHLGIFGIFADKRTSENIFFSLYVFGNQWFIFRNFFLCCPSQRSARSQVPSLGGNPPGDWQSAVGWGDAGFERQKIIRV